MSGQHYPIGFSLLFRRLAMVAVLLLAGASSRAYGFGFSGDFQPSNWFGSNFSFDSFGTALTLNSSSSAQIYPPSSGTAYFSYQGSGNVFDTSAMPTALSGSGSSSVDVVKNGSFPSGFGFNNYSIGSLVITNFSFVSSDPVQPPLDSHLSISPSALTFASLLKPAGTSTSHQVTVTNAGPLSATYSVSEVSFGYPISAITRTGPTGLPLVGSGQTADAFVVNAALDQLGNYGVNYKLNNESDANDNTNNLDSTISVFAYVDSAPKPAALYHDSLLPGVSDLDNVVLGPTTTSGPITPANPVATAQVDFENQYSAGSNTANARIVSRIPSSSLFTAAGAAAGTDLHAGPNIRMTDTYSFDTTGRLNGSYSATVTTKFESGFAAGTDHPETGVDGVQIDDADTYDVITHLYVDVTSSTAGGTAPIAANGTLKGLGSTSSGGTKATLLDGTAGASGANVSISFTPNANFNINGLQAIGDGVQLSGTSLIPVALQLSYTEADLLAAGYTPASVITLEWQDFPGHWTNAVSGNIASHSSQFYNVPYDSSYFVLGNYGYFYDTATNTGTAWAVIDHNSDFALGGSPVPEPCSLALFLPTAFLLRRRR